VVQVTDAALRSFEAYGEAVVVGSQI
jgi:hypothetical protein